MSAKTKIEHQFTSDFIAKQKHQTPFFLISKDRIRERYRSFRRIFPGASIHYALKANSEPGVLKTLADMGCGFEAASFYEIKMLLDLGIQPHRIIYGTAVKPLEHIKAAYKTGVDRFAFDSLPELEHIAKVAPRARVYARAIVDDSGSVFTMSKKFGAPLEAIPALLMAAKKLHLVPYGISFNVGSQASSAVKWRHAIRSVGKIMSDLEEADIRISMLNLGGGYPSLYLSDPKAATLEEIGRGVGSSLDRLPYRPEVIMEPGRGLVAEAAVLVTTVIAKIQREDRTWLYLDAGVYNALFESMVYQGTMRYFSDIVATEPGGKEAKFVLAGPTGDGLDIICEDASLPNTVDVGDRVTFYHVGAYSLSLASQFNGFPLPRAYVV